MLEYQSNVVADGLHFLESPRWHDGALWMSDIGAGKLLTMDSAGSVRTVAEIPGLPSGLGFLPDGTPIVASVYDRCIYRVADGGLQVHANLSKLSESIVSEMIVDRRGRAYIDAYGYDLLAGETLRPSRIILIEPDGSARIVADDLHHPNGLAQTAEGRLVVAETFNCRLLSFAISGDGSLSDQRVEASLPGKPDGLCVDAEDAIWVGVSDFGFARIKDGEILEKVAVEGRKPVACALGGGDGRTLYSVTFQGEVTDILNNPGARVEVATVNVPRAAG